MEVVGIAAVARNGVIGGAGDIPWRIPEDWARFRQITMGHVLVMGRRTYDSIGRPLPGRTTIVVTRDPRWRGEGVRIVSAVEEALPLAAALDAERAFVAGGGQIYRALWDEIELLELTEVDLAPEGSVTFPSLDPVVWRETTRDEHPGFAFVSYRRRSFYTPTTAGDPAVQAPDVGHVTPPSADSVLPFGRRGIRRTAE